MINNIPLKKNIFDNLTNLKNSKTKYNLNLHSFK